ncbi:MAG TPA: hypothetical protein VHB20_01540 [Verrucomicrobiae bacterium]|jgi:hypothetical protein|nr:hypothetical protein [Verrucomicrobiae bacterium]
MSHAVKWAAAALGFVVVGAVVLWPTASPEKRVARLPDGSIVIVAGVSLANNSVYTNAGGAKWEEWLGRTLPYGMLPQKLWAFPGGMSVGARAPAGKTNLVIFLSHLGSLAHAPPQKFDLVLQDEQGNSVSSHPWGTSVMHDAKGTHYDVLEEYVFQAYPRRSKWLKLGWADQTAHFQILNPDFAAFSSWPPVALPATNRVADTVVRLTEFAAGATRKSAEVAVEVTTDGRPDCPWQVAGVEFADATGNAWPGTLQSASQARMGDGYRRTMIFRDHLWHGEKAWKIRVELSNTADFTPGIFWTNRVPVPAVGAAVALNMATNFDGEAVRLVAVKRTTTSLEFSVQSDVEPTDFRLSAVGGKDQLSSGRSLYSFTLASPANASFVDCVLAYHRSRFVDFIAAPTAP